LALASSKFFLKPIRRLKPIERPAEDIWHLDIEIIIKTCLTFHPAKHHNDIN
jgi:hypothetical protein